MRLDLVTMTNLFCSCFIAPTGISPRRRNPEEALLGLVIRAYIKEVLTVEIYSQYARKNLDLLEQGPRGIGR